jgi:hypothetical protein
VGGLVRLPARRFAGTKDPLVTPPCSPSFRRSAPRSSSSSPGS